MNAGRAIQGRRWRRTSIKATALVTPIAMLGWTLALTLVTIPVLGAERAWAEGKSGSGSRSGALGRSTSAVRQKVGPPRTGGSSSGSRPTPVRTGIYHPYDAYGPYYCTTCPIAPSGMRYPGGPGARRAQAKTALALSLGVQSVADSDGAVSGAIRIENGSLGLGLAGTHYFEEGQALDGSDVIRLNVWSLTASGRLMNAGKTAIWFEGGLGGVSSSEFESLLGISLGVAAAYPVGTNMSLTGSGRYYLLEQETQAAEARIGFAIGFMRVGYRSFSFDVGPALHGPEAGMTLQF